MKLITSLKKYVVEVLVAGGVILFAYNFFFEPDQCSVPGTLTFGNDSCIDRGEPSLYFIAVVMIVIGLVVIYNKKKNEE